MIYGIDYYGFVYLWYDTKNKKYIIGSHHGSTEDGYTTSTGGDHVKNIFLKRPETMKRKILAYNSIDDKTITKLLEQKILDKRPHIDKNDRYYNRNNNATGGCGNGGASKGIKRGPQTQAHKEARAKKLRGKKCLPETRLKIKQSNMGKLGRKKTDNDNWQGYWVTPLGRFDILQDAADAHNVCIQTILNRCKTKCDRVLTRGHPGKTWRELGWYFEYKDIH